MENAYLAYGSRSIPDDVAVLLDDPSAQNLVPNSLNFWVLVKSLSEFVKEHQVLPLSGALPDMTSTTSNYIALQRCYRAKASEDLAEVSASVDKMLHALGRSPTSIPAEDRALFCANAYYLHVVRMNAIANEFDAQAGVANASVVQEAVTEGLGDPSPQCPILWYICWRAFDRVSGAHHRVLGLDRVCFFPFFCAVLFSAVKTNISSMMYVPTKKSKMESDAQELLSVAKRLCDAQYKIDPNLIVEAHATEMVRYAGSEPHNIAALIGGIASQEAVKLITAQYIPLNNTYIYNGIAGAGASYNL